MSRIGEGPRNLPINTDSGIQETKSTTPEQSSVAEKTNSALQHETPHQGSAKEASHKKAELNLGEMFQRSALNGLLEEASSRRAQNSNVIRGTSGDDSVHVSKASGLLGALGMYEVNVNGKTQYMTKQQLEASTIKTGAGNDTVVVDSNVQANIHVDGGSGNDVIIGGRGKDLLEGGSGNDVIAGRGGADVIKGDSGDDLILGGAGNDVIQGGRGKDNLNGGRGNDLLDGGQGADQATGGPGIDNIKLDWADYLKAEKKDK